jgi:cyclopropane fatty-acyl-phospholipid synthase-like methyltransferase
MLKLDTRKHQASTVKNFYNLWGFIGGTTLGQYPEINEGIYPTSDTTYEQSMENVYDWYLNNTIKKVTKDRPYKILELGFGYGSLADRFVKTGQAIWTGINNSDLQCEYARKKYKLDQGPHKIFQMSWYDFPYEEHAEQYDFIIARGCLEHYLSSEEAAKGNAMCQKIYADLFTKLEHCLNRQARDDGAGKIVGGLIFMRHLWSDDQLQRIVDDKQYNKYSDLYFVKKITRTWGGHYPSSLNEFFSVLNEKMVQLVLEDGTRDYFYTTADWRKLIRKNLLKGILKQPYHVISYFLKNGRNSFMHIKDIFIDGAWGWQFTPRQDWENFSDTPCRLYRFVFQTK